LLYFKVIGANSSYPGLVSHLEFMALRMPYPGFETEEDPESRGMAGDHVKSKFSRQCVW
jgi:hypothetical protein